MRRVLLVGLWVDRDLDGDVPQRFRHLPELFVSRGLELSTVHRTELDTATWIAAPPVGMIFSGSRSNLGEDCSVADYPELNRLLAELPQVPVLGICFGHQFLAAHNGGTLGRCGHTREDNDFAITPIGEHPLFDGLPRPVPLAENHGMRVVDPGPGYELIATSPDGIEGMVHCELPRIGVQFHPEYYPRQRHSQAGRRVLENWIGLL